MHSIRIHREASESCPPMALGQRQALPLCGVSDPPDAFACIEAVEITPRYHKGTYRVISCGSLKLLQSILSEPVKIIEELTAHCRWQAAHSAFGDSGLCERLPIPPQKGLFCIKTPLPEPKLRMFFCR